MTQAEKTTDARFTEWAALMAEMQAVPMLVVCTGIGMNHPLCGRIICMNSQGRGLPEMISFLRETIRDLEAQAGS
jgi:hypothetical protein